jgi:hypothetical protein
VSAADKGAWHKRLYSQLRFLRSAGRLGAAIATREFLNPAGGIDEFLFAGEKRMASGTDADFNVLAGRACVIDRPAGTDNIGFVILRMNTRFHFKKERET